MTPDEKHLLAVLLRKFFVILAERRAAITLLCETQSKASVEQRLEEIRKTPEYQGFLAGFEPMIAKIEEEADLEALIPLLTKASEGKLPN